MPTIECLLGELRGKIDEMEKAREVRDDALDARLERIEGKVDGVISDRDADKNQISGAMWAFSKIGAGVVALLGLLGWLAVNGVPIQLKRIFTP